MKTTTFKTAIAATVTILSLFSCKPGTDHMSDAFWLVWLGGQDNLEYNNCAVKDPAILDAGTHQVALQEGEEYWFDFRSREVIRLTRQYEIQIQEQTGQDIKAVFYECIQTNAITNPQPDYTMGEDYLTDSGSSGALEIYTVETNKSLEYGEFVVGIKSVTGSGTIDLTIPTGSL